MDIKKTAGSGEDPTGRIHRHGDIRARESLKNLGRYVGNVVRPVISKMVNQMGKKWATKATASTKIPDRKQAKKTDRAAQDRLDQNH